MAESARVCIAKLNNQNYQVWKYKVELWNVVCQDRPENVDEAWTIKDGKARATIGLLLEDNQLGHVKKQVTAKGSWEALRDYHQKSTLSNKVSLLKKLCALKLDENGNMETHINQMENLVDQLSGLGEPVAEQLIVALLLSSLPDSYGTLITALETRPERDLTTELVKNKMLEEYTRRKESKLDERQTSEKALKISTGNTAERKGNCFFCNKPNHIKKDCRKYIAWKEKISKHKANKVSQNKKEISVDESNDNIESYVCFKAAITGESSKWYIDSGATAHMCNVKDFFQEIDTNVKDKITLADGQNISSEGIGKGFLHCKTGTGNLQKVLVKNVLYVPKLKGNLLSVEALVRQGMTVHFEEEQCQIKAKDKIVATADVHNSLYELNETQQALNVIGENKAHCIHEWHRRLGHRDPSAIKMLQSKNLATGIQLKECDTIQTCECCIQGKMSRKPFSRNLEIKSTEILEVIHSDVCGPMQTITPGNKKYVLSLIDDYSRYTKIYLLEYKSEAVKKIKEYVSEVKTNFGKTPKVIRTDRGGEYMVNELKDFLRAQGIQAQTTAPYTPQQNGVAERKNRSLLEMTRCMLIDAGLHNQFWGEAIYTANHLQNRLPTKIVKTTPYERWHGKKPKLNYIRTFGSTAYVMTPKEKRQKLDNKATKMTFVGYEEGSKAYRLLDKNTNKIQVSREVKFIEENVHDKCYSEIKELSKQKEEDEETEESIEVILSDKQSVFDENKEKQNAIEMEPVRRSVRENKGRKPERLIEAVNMVTENVHDEPKTYNEAIQSKEAQHWIKAMDKEMTAMKENKIWTMTELPQDKVAIGSKWVYKIKQNERGEIDKYKARLVAQGYSQKYGQDYDEVFAPVIKSTTLRTFLTIAGKRNMTVRHYDIETAYLNGDLSHDVYMKPPKGYSEGDDLVCKLNKNLYGLKQGAKEWNKKLNTILIGNNFKRSEIDPCLYSKQVNGEWIFILVYVDDILGGSTIVELLDDFERDIDSEFKIKNLGDLKYYLGIQFERDDEGIFLLHQGNYIDKKLKEFNLTDCKTSNVPMDPGYQKRNEIHEPMENNEMYRSAIGSLLYLASNSRPDIASSTCILARKVSNPQVSDWTEVKRVFKYLKKTKNKKLKLGGVSHYEENDLVCFVDADWGGDQVDRKSNSGYCFILYGGTISWACRKQTSVALSSTEAEYIALAEATQEAIWIERLLIEFQEKIQLPVLVFEDNQSCIKMLEEDRVCKRTKHIETKYHFVRDLKQTGKIKVAYCPSMNMVADLLTKPLESVKLRKFTYDIGLRD